MMTKMQARYLELNFEQWGTGNWLLLGEVQGITHHILWMRCHNMRLVDFWRVRKNDGLIKEDFLVKKHHLKFDATAPGEVFIIMENS